MNNICLAFFAFILLASECSQQTSMTTRVDKEELQQDTIYRIERQEHGPTLGYSPASGVSILTIDGLKFKDLNRNGQLDPYEDWRLSADERARDLASKMSVEEIAGLMLYSAHQSIPAAESGFGAGMYGGKAFSVSGALASDLTDDQKKFLSEDHLRHILITRVESPAVAAEWNNRMQAYTESIGWGIPNNTSSDPRHTAMVSAEFNAGAGGDISLWPDGLAIASTFDPNLVRRYGETVAREYRALGITTALSPQIDLGTDPRWYRISMTFGEHPGMSTDMARAYIDGLQTSADSAEIAEGWGYHSVNAMVKHWPGGGTGEGGRDAHWAFGKFAVYPGKNFQTHLQPFINGAFKLDGKTGKASAVMPYYTISYNQAPDKSNVGNGFSRWIVTDLLREKYGYDGVVCTDWGITQDEGKSPDDFQGKPWGVEELSVAERHYMAIRAGVDQFGGNNEKEPILEAYRMGVEEQGEEYMRQRFEQSAVRLLRNIFRLGLFENPYIDPAESARLVGNPDYMQAGFEAQIKSVILLKNKDSLLPQRDHKTVFIPKRIAPEIKDWWGNLSKSSYDYPVNMEKVANYYLCSENPDNADFAIVFVKSPHSHADGGGYDRKDRNDGGNGYVPISLQYSQYTAIQAREKSMAAGDPVIDPDITNRSYKNKSSRSLNHEDLDLILETKKQMGGKPVIVVVHADRPMVFCEFEHQVEGILLHFGVSEQAVLDIISGREEPSALLPVQIPSDMNTVEKQREDVPFDMKCHTDTEGNTYDFGYGLNWSGVIRDERTERYKIN